jgi:hypothetical protein
MAEAWLAGAHGVPQRAITTRRVTAYASAMTRGQWRVTHQAIAIDPAGVLIDGQHRLAAVVTARKVVRMLVAFDVPRESFDVLDTGQARSSSSILHMAGEADANALAAAARAVLTYQEIDGTRRIPSADVRGMFTARDVLEFVGSERGDVLKANMVPARMIGVACGRNGIRSWVAAALTLIDLTDPLPTTRSMFVERWETGEMLSTGNPILTLRRWLMSEHGYQRSIQAYRGPTGIAAAIRAWNAYSNGHDLALIRIRPGKERWPVVGRDDIDAADAETAPPTLDIENIADDDAGQRVAV